MKWNVQLTTVATFGEGKAEDAVPAGRQEYFNELWVFGLNYLDILPQGCLWHMPAVLRYLAGGGVTFKKINYIQMKVKVLFVCLGNICRSPLAMSLFIHAVKERNLSSHFEIDSCGTSNYHIGESPDRRTVENAIRNGLKVEHAARQLAREDLEKFDYIIAMDRSNLQNVKKLDPAGQYSDKIHLMRDFDPMEKGTEVPDPFFGGDEGFQNVYNILKRSVNHFLDVLVEKHNLSTVSK